ncbi:MAG: DUF4342 domain-containing protein [Candidatus Geothermarchaeales archaeon]
MPHCVKCGIDLPESARFCTKCGSPVASTKKGLVEEFFVATEDLVKRVKGLIHEGNVRRIIVKNEGEKPSW